jgi:hypothetical protein
MPVEVEVQTLHQERAAAAAVAVWQETVLEGIREQAQAGRKEVARVPLEGPVL